MSSFLLGLLGVVVGLALVIVVGWFWLKRKFKRFVQGLGEAFAGLGGGVSPFRITLEPSDEPGWSRGETVDSVTAALQSIGYVHAGDYVVPEMEGVTLRGLVNTDASILAALFEHSAHDQPMLDLMRLNQDRHHVLVSTAPEDGLDTPPRKSVQRVSHDLSDTGAVGDAVAAMHRQVLEGSAGRTPVPIAPRLFALTFTTAYAADMDWRIERGGVTAEEVRGAAAAGGMDPPDDDQIDTVQRQWRSAISQFVGEEAERAFLAGGTVSAAQWEDMRDRILVVHEHSDREELVDALAAEAIDAEIARTDDGDDDDDDDRYAAVEQQIRGALDGADLMAGFESARQALPRLAGYEHLGDVEKPWRGRIYLTPDVG